MDTREREYWAGVEPYIKRWAKGDDDMAQQMRIGAWRAYHRGYDPAKGRPYSWAKLSIKCYATAENAARRTHKRHLESSAVRLDQRVGKGGERDMHEVIGDKAMGAHDRAVLSQTVAEMRAVLGDDAAAALLRTYLGETNEELGAERGVSRQAVHQGLAKARKKWAEVAA